MSVQQRDDELCRKRGWPTVTEQKAHWDKQGDTVKNLLATLRNLTAAVEGLRDICKHQQQQIDNLNKRNKIT